MIGIVLELEPDLVNVNLNNKLCNIKRKSFTVYDPVSKIVVSERIQFPLKPCYAITVHKSQGLTLDAAIVGCSKAYLPGQI
jgi:ATP-dependent exoDNAse (exonuclease V) alpha subunit